MEKRFLRGKEEMETGLKGLQKGERGRKSLRDGCERESLKETKKIEREERKWIKDDHKKRARLGIEEEERDKENGEKQKEVQFVYYKLGRRKLGWREEIKT